MAAGGAIRRVRTRRRGSRRLAAAAIVLAAGALAVVAAAQVGGPPSPRIAVHSTVVAEPASKMPLLIRIAPVESIPPKAFLRLRGLPHTAALSEGHVIAPGSWAVPLSGLLGLTLSVPGAAVGRSELVISLVGEDGTLIAETRVALVIEHAAPQPAKASPALPAAPAAPVPPAATQMQAKVPAVDLEAAERLLTRGDRDLEQGNVAVARQFYLRAAQMGLAKAALMLGATYDPRELARLRAVGVQPNVAEARKWYERAIELGLPEAKERLATLGGGG